MGVQDECASLRILNPKPYHGEQGRMKRLEQVRLEVDSRRHTVNALNRAIAQKQKKAPQAGAPPTRGSQSIETQIELTIRRMQHKENKLAGAGRSRLLCI